MFSLFFIPFIINFAFCLSISLPNNMLNKNHSQIKNYLSIYSFLEKYRQTVENKNIKKFMSLIAKDFTSKNKNKDLHYGCKQLQSKTKQIFSLIKKHNLDIYLQKVEKNTNRFYIYYYSKQKILMNHQTSKKWTLKENLNIIIIINKNKKFQILAGI